MQENKLVINAFLFDGFTGLDLFGPLEVLSRLDNAKCVYISLRGGVVKSTQGCAIQTSDLSAFVKNNTLLIPGGFGTRVFVNDEVVINALSNLVCKSKFTLGVCTASALLAQTTCLNGKKATTNTKAFEWVKSQNERVLWQENTRFVKDENIYTSAGVSAGIDMAFAFVRENYGERKAKEIATSIEYKAFEG